MFVPETQSMHQFMDYGSPAVATFTQADRLRSSHPADRRVAPKRKKAASECGRDLPIMFLPLIVDELYEVSFVVAFHESDASLLVVLLESRDNLVYMLI